MTSGEFEGICFGLTETSGQSCRVLPGGAALTVIADGERLAELDYRGLSVSLSGVDDRYLTFEARLNDRDVRILVADRALAVQIEALGASGQFVEQLRRITAKRTRRTAARWSILAVAVGVVAAVALTVWLSFGWIVGKAVAAIPVEWEVEIGRSSSSQILEEKQVCVDPELTRAAEEIGRRLVNSLGASPYAFKLRVVDSSEVNAFALPGGYIFINRGLVEQAGDGHEVAGVLAHEIQHVVGRHGLHNMVRQAGFFLLLAAVVGDAGQLEQFLAYNAAGLASMSFSRSQERAADAGGLELMRHANLDMTGLPRFLTKLAAKESLPEFLTFVSSHPASTERVKRLNATIKSIPDGKIVPLQTTWEGIGSRCSPVPIKNPDAH
ncbi:MAG: M48 family metallopeptidase [Deltaproteobacteria bacterium]|nr:M48 family metallopeptidase [Deltaproteobacteria bacterium]